MLVQNKIPAVENNKTNFISEREGFSLKPQRECSV